MSSSNAPFGFICARSGNGQSFARPFPIASGYAVNIFQGDPVKLVGTDGLNETNGTVDLATTDGARASACTSPVLGIFAGCEYTDSTGKPVKSNYWPASTVASDAVAYVYEASANEFTVQCDGSIAATKIGSQTNTSGFNTSSGGSTSTGRSTATVSATLIGDDAQGQWTIVDFDRSVDNVAGDSYTKVVVRCANPQLWQAARTAQNAAGT